MHIVYAVMYIVYYFKNINRIDYIFVDIMAPFCFYAYYYGLLGFLSIFLDYMLYFPYTLIYES